MRETPSDDKGYPVALHFDGDAVARQPPPPLPARPVPSYLSSLPLVRPGTFGRDQQNLWFCSRNTWNLQQASCDAPREGARYSDEDLLNQVISSTRYESVIDDRAWTRSPAPELPASSTGPRHTVEPVRSAVPSSSDQYSLTSAASSPISRRGSPELLLEAAVRYRSASEQAGAGGGGGGGVGSSTLDSTSAASGSSSGVRPQKRHRSGGNCSPVQEGRDDCGDRGGISWAEPEDISGEVYGAADLLVYWKVKHDKAALGGSESKRRRVD